MEALLNSVYSLVLCCNEDFFSLRPYARQEEFKIHFEIWAQSVKSKELGNKQTDIEMQRHTDIFLNSNHTTYLYIYLGSNYVRGQPAVTDQRFGYPVLV